MACCEFEGKTSLFLRWFKALPGASFHPNLEIRDLRSREAGRGIIAVEDIPEETILFTVPRSAIISTLTSSLSSKVPNIFAEIQCYDQDEDEEFCGDMGSQVPDQWLSLILVMIYEFLHSGTSPWAPYLGVLPDSFETPMFWSHDELAQLQVSSVLDKIGKEQAEDMFRSKLVPVVRKYEHVFLGGDSPPLSDDELVCLAHRMGSTIMAYAFDLENEEVAASEDGECGWIEDKEDHVMMGMVPMADILNADAEFNAHVNHGEHCLTVTSLRPIKAGEEVLNYYGPHPNSDLLRRYGYVTQKHSRYDVVELSWDTTLSVTRQVLDIDDKAWGKAVNAMDPDEIEDTFVLERESCVPDSEGLLKQPPARPSIPLDMEEQLNMFLEALSKASPALGLDRAKRKDATGTVAYKVFEAKLAQYPTTVEEDRHLLSDKYLSRRQNMALLVRIGEKTLLQEALDALRGETNQSATLMEDAGPLKKKARQS